jgi:hypothetical protein
LRADTPGLVRPAIDRAVGERLDGPIFLSSNATAPRVFRWVPDFSEKMIMSE